ncbi:MAG: hypothetical protein R3F31_25325 [Verrucomicrobiales bacterium]
MTAPARQTLCSRLRDNSKRSGSGSTPGVLSPALGGHAGRGRPDRVSGRAISWSRDPDTFSPSASGAGDLRVPSRRWFHVGVDRDGDHRADETISGTGSHPWYVLTPAGSASSARELQAGDILSLRDGTRAWVTDKTREVARTDIHHLQLRRRRPPHLLRGEGGVWVHNTCKELLEDIVALNKTHLDELGDHDEAVKKALRR